MGAARLQLVAMLEGCQRSEVTGKWEDKYGYQYAWLKNFSLRDGGDEDGFLGPVSGGSIPRIR